MSAVQIETANDEGRTTALALWHQVNRALAAKILAELCYEQALSYHWVGDANACVQLTPDISYQFSAKRSIWDFLLIDPQSLRRCHGDETHPVTDAAQLLLDARSALDVSGPTLGNLLHEIANTLAADVALRKRRRQLSAASLAQLPDNQLQALLDGHPKALANKGRIGWGATEFAAYGTEANAAVQLHWLAVDRRIADAGFLSDIDPWRLLDESMTTAQLTEMRRRLDNAGVDKNAFLPLPVHPWQWQHYVQHHYQQELAVGSIIHLGALGESYLPLLSLRTLANAHRPRACHLKLPLTVLNTSCFRGITGRYMQAGPALSHWLARRCEDDAVFKTQGTRILQEFAGIHVPSRHHEQLPDTPYRYRELLGAVWRDSPEAAVRPGERPMTYAALLQRDDNGTPIILALITRSELTPDEWLQRLFNVSVVPLYHLLCRYGLALVAHAQNLTLYLKDNAPVGLALKDFHGDLRRVRLAQEEPDYPELAELPDQAKNALTALPPEYLIHDLFTGHFVTVLRFLSALMWTDLDYPEARFYRLLGDCLRDYQHTHPSLAERFTRFDLFRPKVERVCINRVRLHVGYDDSGERPVPMLAGELDNPLVRAYSDHSPRCKQGAVAHD